jgi:NAD(P)-dependent dehydrogenase (short-subunit alcohol dehydrogenase family)
MNSLAQHIGVEEPAIATVSVGPGRVDTDMQKEIRETGSAMDSKDHASFVSGFEEGKLNKPEWPGQVIAKLAVEAKTDLRGGYYRYSSSSKKRRKFANNVPQLELAGAGGIPRGLVEAM